MEGLLDYAAITDMRKIAKRGEGITQRIGGNNTKTIHGAKNSVCSFFFYF